MTTTIPHLDEPAQQLARIRRLERDLEAERANVARERRSNSTLALELFEARELAKALAAEVETAKLDYVRNGVSQCVNLQAEIDSHKSRWLELRRRIKDCSDHVTSGHPYKSGMQCVLDMMERLECTITPQENGAAE